MLNSFLQRSRYDVFQGYNRTHTIALWSALLISYRKVNQDIVLLKHLKGRPNQLKNATVQLLTELTGDFDPLMDYTNLDLVEKWSHLINRQVVIVASPVNDDSCAPEHFRDVPFSVVYSTRTTSLLTPVVVWETRVTDDSDTERVHYHSVLNWTQSMEWLIRLESSDTVLDVQNVRPLMTYLRSTFSQEDVPPSIPLYAHQTDTPEELEDEFKSWLITFQQSLGVYTWVNNVVVPRPFLLKDILERIERYKDTKTRVAEHHKRWSMEQQERKRKMRSV